MTSKYNTNTGNMSSRICYESKGSPSDSQQSIKA